MTNKLCEHKFRLNEANKGHACPDCYPFKVGDNMFATFDEVIQWAWDTHKIDSNSDIEPHMYQQACSELEAIIATFE